MTPIGSSGEICVVRSDFRFVKAWMRLHADAQGTSRMQHIFKHCYESHLSSGRTHLDHWPPETVSQKAWTKTTILLYSHCLEIGNTRTERLQGKWTPQKSVWRSECTQLNKKTKRLLISRLWQTNWLYEHEKKMSSNFLAKMKLPLLLKLAWQRKGEMWLKDNRKGREGEHLPASSRGNGYQEHRISLPKIW